MGFAVEDKTLINVY